MNGAVRGLPHAIYSPCPSVVFNNWSEYAWFCITRQKYLEWVLHTEPAVSSVCACACVCVCVACSEWNTQGFPVTAAVDRDRDRDRDRAQPALSAVPNASRLTSSKIASVVVSSSQRTDNCPSDEGQKMSRSFEDFKFRNRLEFTEYWMGQNSFPCRPVNRSALCPQSQLWTWRSCVWDPSPKCRSAATPSSFKSLLKNILPLSFTTSNTYPISYTYLNCYIIYSFIILCATLLISFLNAYFSVSSCIYTLSWCLLYFVESTLNSHVVEQCK